MNEQLMEDVNQTASASAEQETSFERNQQRINSEVSITITAGRRSEEEAKAEPCRNGLSRNTASCSRPENQGNPHTKYLNEVQDIPALETFDESIC